ncbi:MAG: tRNA lysidine(34) synthetase TilS [Eubacteriales bacterium]|nr:tRNA lysidine(34) synthetase TilS [Eubacteriales bacterium]
MFQVLDLAIENFINTEAKSLSEAFADDPMILALSGGSDSLMLLLALLRYQQHHGRQFDLHIFHFDHGWRPESSDEQIELRRFIEELNLPFHGRKAPKLEVASLKFGPEASARGQRYQALSELRDQLTDGQTGDIFKESKPPWVFLAHHADDQIETFFINLSRGSGLDGFVALKTVRGALCRPLLQLQRSELDAIVGAFNIPFLHDSSNQDLNYLRNRIRHQVLPELELELGPSIRKQFLRSLSYLEEDQALLYLLLDQKWKQICCEEQPDYFIVNLRELSAGLSLRLIKLALDRRVIDYSYHELEILKSLLQEDVHNHSQLHRSFKSFYFTRRNDYLMISREANAGNLLLAWSNRTYLYCSDFDCLPRANIETIEHLRAGRTFTIQKQAKNAKADAYSYFYTEKSDLCWRLISDQDYLFHLGKKRGAKQFFHSKQIDQYLASALLVLTDKHRIVFIPGLYYDLDYDQNRPLGMSCHFTFD